MDLIQKIEFVLVLFLLFFNILFLINPEVISGLFLSEDRKTLSAPYDFIKEEQIVTYKDRIVLEIEDYSLSRYAPSKSMVPVLDYGATGIGIKPKSEDELHIGDIITFRQDDDLIVHRIVEKGIDKDGWFFITKGDNNNITDGKIRFSQIDSVLVALIY